MLKNRFLKILASTCIVIFLPYLLGVIVEIFSTERQGYDIFHAMWVNGFILFCILFCLTYLIFAVYNILWDAE